MDDPQRSAWFHFCRSLTREQTGVVLAQLAKERRLATAPLLESLEFVKRPLAFNSSNGYQSCQNCGSGWFPADGEPETHDPRCPYVVLGGESA